MSTLLNLWAVTKGFDKGAHVEERIYSDGTFHYSFRDRLGHLENLDSKEQAMKIVEKWHMELVA